MESPTPMTHEELLEQAALDALGLLDQYEALLFTRSFHRATATVQKQIVEFQAELAADESLLPDETPSPELRDRILAAVAEAVESQEADFAPLASIGGRVERQFDPALSSRRPNRSNAIFLRIAVAAVLVLGVALIIVSYFGMQAVQLNNQLAKAAFSEKTLQEFEDELGPSFKEFVGHPDCNTIRFTASDPEFEGAVTLYLNEKTQEAYVLATSMPIERFALVASSGSTVNSRQSFDIAGPIAGVRLTNLSPATVASSSWSIRDSRGMTVMQSG